MYPTSATTYTLPFPFGDRIRVNSKRRFVLVRTHSSELFSPFIVKRSDSMETLLKEFNRAGGDFIIDQAEGTVRFAFNGHVELHTIGTRSRDSRFLRVVTV